MGLATCPEGTLSGSLLGECGLMALCSTWLSGEEGASSEQPRAAHLPAHTHRHFHTLTSHLTYSWDVPGETGIVLPPAQAGIHVGVWGRGSLFSAPSRIPHHFPTPHLTISFLFFLLLLFKYFLKLFNPWVQRLRKRGGR